MESQRLPRSRNFYRAPSSTDHPPILFSLSRRHLFGRSKGMTTGGKWLALPLIFRDRPLETFAPKNPIGRSIGFVRSDFRFKHSHENFWQLIFGCEGLGWSIAGQARHLPPVVIPLVESSVKLFSPHFLALSPPR